MRDAGVAVGEDVIVCAFFDTLAQFYRQAYLRWIDATTRRPDLRAARIAEVVGLARGDVGPANAVPGAGLRQRDCGDRPGGAALQPG
jgi:hypothetical protein